MHTNIIFFLIKFQAIFYPSTKIYILLAENPPPPFLADMSAKNVIFEEGSLIFD